jgi:hypothetical protein
VTAWAAVRARRTWANGILLRSIASLDPQDPGSARKALTMARNALRDVSPSDR